MKRFASRLPCPISKTSSLNTLSGSPSAQVGTIGRRQRSGAVGKRVPRGMMTVYCFALVRASWVSSA